MKKQCSSSISPKTSANKISKSCSKKNPKISPSNTALLDYQPMPKSNSKTSKPSKEPGTKIKKKKLSSEIESPKSKMRQITKDSALKIED